MIDENILAECLRTSSSCGGLSISPLAPQYVPPRGIPLSPKGTSSARGGRAGSPAGPGGQAHREPRWMTRPELSSCDHESQQKAGPEAGALLFHARTFSRAKGGCFGHAVLFRVTGNGRAGRVVHAYSFPPPVKEASTGNPIPSALSRDQKSRGMNPECRGGPPRRPSARPEARPSGSEGGNRSAQGAQGPHRAPRRSRAQNPTPSVLTATMLV